MMHLNNTVYKQLPNIMRWLIIYLVATILLCFFGPIEWNIRNSGLVVFYLACYMIALKVGYDVGFRKKVKEPMNSAQDVSRRDLSFINKLLIIGIVFNILLAVRMSNSLSISAILTNITNGLFAPAEQYRQFHEAASSGYLHGGNWFSLLITFGQPCSIASLILAIFYYPQLSKGLKALTWSAFVVHLAVKFIAAANEGVFDTFIYIGVAYYLRTINQSFYVTKLKRKIRKVVVLVTIALLAVVALSYFTQNILGRTDGNFAFGTLGENYFK